MSGSRQLSACSKAPHDTAVIPTKLEFVSPFLRFVLTR